ncbi:hypothetical protein J4468_03415 [Candidatus Woesearchaeota archaeon]|nr:hypothetical protein [Candidatus Woesearchaeota archaeon]
MLPAYRLNLVDKVEENSNLSKCQKWGLGVTLIWACGDYEQFKKYYSGIDGKGVLLSALTHQIFNTATVLIGVTVGSEILQPENQSLMDHLFDSGRLYGFLSLGDLIFRMGYQIRYGQMVGLLGVSKRAINKKFNF